MSPFVRPNFRSADSGEGGDLRLRLNILTALVVLQLVFTVFLLCSRPASEQIDAKTMAAQDEKAQQAEVKKPVVEEVKAKPESAPREEPRAVATPEPEKRPDWSKIQIDVLNGCGENGIAGKARRWLEKRGYRIHDATNADRHDYRDSFIQLRKGEYEAAAKLAADLGIQKTQIFDIRSDKEEKVNLTLVIGLDFGRLSFGK